MASPEALEKKLDRLFRSLPDRPAPATLEERVFREIARRAALPWWRRSFVAWPAWARGVFLLLAAAAAGGLMYLFTQAQAAPVPEAANLAHVVQPWQAAFTSLGQLLRDAVAAIPAVWLYGAVAAIAGCYVMLAAVGAAVLRLARH